MGLSPGEWEAAQGTLDGAQEGSGHVVTNTSFALIKNLPKPQIPVSEVEASDMCMRLCKSTRAEFLHV